MPGIRKALIVVNDDKGGFYDLWVQYNFVTALRSAMRRGYIVKALRTERGAVHVVVTYRLNAPMHGTADLYIGAKSGRLLRATIQPTGGRAIYSEGPARPRTSPGYAAPQRLYGRQVTS